MNIEQYRDHLVGQLTRVGVEGPILLAIFPPTKGRAQNPSHGIRPFPPSLTVSLTVFFWMTSLIDLVENTL